MAKLQSRHGEVAKSSDDHISFLNDQVATLLQSWLDVIGEVSRIQEWA